MMLCVVCTVHKKMRSASFLVWPQNHGIPFVSGLTSKSLGRVSQFGPQNRQLWFDDLGLKITATVSWFESKKMGYDLSVAPQNRRRMKTVWDMCQDLAV
jgi:hypothetical protein